MKDFFGDDLFLSSDSAKAIYNQVKDLPIIDYHCHLDQNKIANDEKFIDIGELWLSGDHYKWRAMRLCGVDEYYITGNASYKDKFIKYSEILPKMVGNALYYWTHMELSQMANRNDFDWDKIFEGVEWFHFTGITPALSDEVAEICVEACQKAKEKNITISCDLNFRKKLWSKEKAGQVMSKLCEYIDYCIANEEDAKDEFGIEADNTDIYGGKLDREGYISVAKKLTERFNFKGVAITLRESKSANDNDWSGMLYTDGQAYFSKKYSMHIVDRVGGGDSFGGGLIYSLVNGFEPQKAIEFAVAASCLKHTIEGDYNMVSVAEVQNLAGGDASGRVQR